MIKKCIGVHVKYPFCLSDMNKIWIYSQNFKKFKNKISWKYAKSKASSSMCKEGDMDRHSEAYSRFSKFFKFA
jgi:hypothetical protein